MIETSKAATPAINKAINPIDFRFSNEFFSRIPNSPGVFWMKDSRRNILFVGASADLKKDLLYYKNVKLHEAPIHFSELSSKVKQIDWNSTNSLENAKQMMNSLIKQCNPPFNKRQKVVRPMFISIHAKTPSKVLIQWSDTNSKSPHTSTFGPFYGKNNIHRTFSAIARWVWLIGNSQSAMLIPPIYTKPLLRNGLEIPINQIFFENQKWIHSLTQYLGGHSDLFIDLGLKKIQVAEKLQLPKVHKDLFHEDLALLEKFFKRYSKIQLSGSCTSAK